MSDLISRQVAIDIVLEYARRLYRHVGTPEDNEMYSFGRGLLLSIERNLKQLPSAQPMRKKGKWITKSTKGEMFDICSECGYVEWDKPNNYCPNCGSYNGGDKDEN